MRRVFKLSAALATLLVLAGSSYATVLLDQTTWSSGTRTSQNLPTRSAWFSSSSGSLSVSGGALRMAVGSSSGMAITYFTTNGSAPVQLNVGDTLTTTFRMNYNGVPTNASSSQGFRIGIFDFADGSNVPLRVTADGGFSSSSQGLFVQGWSLFGKMYTAFGDNQPIDVRKRTVISDNSLLGASGDWTSISKTGQNTNIFSGFANGTLYTLQFAFQRSNLTTLVISETWSNLSNGATLSVTTADSLATNFSFDGIAFRPANNTQAAATNNFTEVKVEYTSSPVPATIITNPQDQDVASGSTVTFTVVPNGTLPLFYQWYFNTNTPLANATNFTYTISSVDPTNVGGYSVIVSNAYGVATSTVAQLSVAVNGPTITNQPQDMTVIPGQTATFSVGASGSLPLLYQWYYNTNSIIPNATASTLTLTNVQPGDAGVYSVVVSNPIDSVTSSYANLTVNTNPVAPVFLTQPQPASVTVYVGTNVSFSAAAVGTQPISYQWNVNSAPIAGATTTTLVLTNVQTTDSGNYTLTASNYVGSTISSAAVLTVLSKTPPLPVIPTNNVNVTNYNAVGDGTTDNSGSIQNAINAVAALGGGTVEIPSGGSLSTYLSGPITLASSVNLQIDSGAMLQMLPKTSWPGGGSGVPFINGAGLHDVEISGPGTIDGQGSTWWPAGDPRPYFIDFSSQCQRVLIQNVTLQNPPKFHLMLKGGNVSVTIQDVNINTPFSGNTAPNTDGMDLGSTNVLVQNCTISDGDDNMEIGSSADAAADITVSNCTFGVGHGVSFGSQIQGGVHDVLVSNCTFNGTDQGIRFKSDRDIGGLVQNIQFRDITMSNVGYAVILYDFYDTVSTPNSITPTTAANDAPQPVITTTPIWQNILLSNVTATALTGSHIGGILWARQEMPVTNFTLQNVNIAAPTKTFCIYNATGVQIIDSNLGGPTSTNTLTMYNASIIVSNSAFVTNLVTLTGLVRPGTNNNMAFYDATATITDTNVLGAGSLALGGSVLTFKQNSVTSSNSLCVSSPSTLAFNGGANTLNATVKGSGDLLVNVPGSASLTLRADNSDFAGALVISNNGTVFINNTTGSGTGTGAVTVASGATLGGAGTIGGPVTVNGALAPGNSPGTLTVSNNLVANDTAALQYQLGTSSDLTAVSGDLTLGGTLNVNDAGGFTNTTYTLFTYGGALTYSGLAIGTVPSTNFIYAISTNTVGQVNLIVSYPPPPVASFTAGPLSGAAPLTVSFTDTSSGSPADWFWTFGDGGTSTSENPTYTYVTPGAWTASLIASNTYGASSPFTQTINVYDPYAWWSQTYFGSTNCAACGGNAFYTGNGMSNTNAFMAGFNPTNSAAYLHIVSAVKSGTNIVVTYLGANGDNTYTPGIASRTNVLDFTTGTANGSYTNGGWQDTGQTNILSGGNGLGMVTNMTDFSGATNVPSRYYRVRVLLP
ncbi:MAG TPA: glycosyl hydrolase family 28 protein [Verrucomicrobiae bacterium]|nr:glycosyl hydrolase family 28 protein [Verrucomicrobiae bacterium]